MIKSSDQIREKHLFDCLRELMDELEECFKNEDEFQKKAKVLSQIREIQTEIIDLKKITIQTREVKL